MFIGPSAQKLILKGVLNTSRCHSNIRAASGSIKPSDLPVPVGENKTASSPVNIIVYDFC